MSLQSNRQISISDINKNLYITSGNVGISTTTPAHTLDVNGGVRSTNFTTTNALVTNTSSGTLNLSTGITSASAQITNSNVTTETIGTALVTTNLLAIGSSNTLGNIFTTGGSVGIGTTSPATDNGSRLSVVGSAFDGSAGIIRLYPSSFGNKACIGFLSGQSSGSYWTLGRQNASNEFALSLSTNTAGMYFFSNGNVSCGPLTTTSLTTGTILASTSISSGAVNATNSTVTNVVATNISSGTLNLSTGITSASAQITNSNVTTETIGTARITSTLMAIGNSNTVGSIFTTNGNVGIGTTGPSSALNVKGGGVAGTVRMYPSTYNSESSIGFYSGETSGSYWVAGKGSWSAGDGFGIGGSAYNGGIMYFSTSGNVGIGTSSPTAKLNVVGDSDVFGTLRVGASSSSSSFLINLGTSGSSGNYRSGYFYGDGTTYQLINQQNGSINFGTNNTANRFVIYADGRCGIGTSSTPPNNGLQINSGEFQLGPSDSNAIHISGSAGAFNFYSGSWGAGTFLGSWNTTGLGIGTGSPNSSLHISKSANGAVTTYLENTNSGSSAYVSYVLKADQGSVFSIFKNSTTRTADGGVNTTTIRNDGGALRMQSSTGNGMMINTYGNIGVSIASPLTTLHIKGNSNNVNQMLTLENYYASSNIYWKLGPDNGSNHMTVYNHNNIGVYMYNDANTWSSTSDIRIKKDVETLTSGLDVVDQLRPVKYRYTQDDAEQTLRIGFIAQEVRDLIPELVNSRSTEDFPDGLLGLSLESFVPFLVNAIKELSSELKNVKQRLDQM